MHTTHDIAPSHQSNPPPCLCPAKPSPSPRHTVPLHSAELFAPAATRYNNSRKPICQNTAGGLPNRAPGASPYHFQSCCLVWGRPAPQRVPIACLRRLRNERRCCWPAFNEFSGCRSCVELSGLLSGSRFVWGHWALGVRGFGISGLSGGGSLVVSAVLRWSSWEPEVSRFALIDG